jgi:two-component system sensor histidine kinase ResE
LACGSVFANLIINALRHTPEGGQVVVRALRGEPGVRFEVSDTGGAGLGLFIAKEIVAAHRGAIRVDSEVGQGARPSGSICPRIKET